MSAAIIIPSLYWIARTDVPVTIGCLPRCEGWGRLKWERDTLGVLNALREPGNPQSLIGPTWVEHATRDFTALGGEPVLTLLTTIVVLYFALAGRHDLSLFTLFSVVVGTILTFTLKGLFDRPRPDLGRVVTRWGASG